MMNKRGLSAVIISLILILLAIVVSGVLWVVISNVVQTGSEEISLEGFFLDLQIENVKVESNGDVSVTVKRGAGDADLTGINFIVSDGDDSVVARRDTTLQELGTSTFTITQAELTTIALVKEVSIAPIIIENEQEKTGRVATTETLSNKQILEDIGAVSWWRFEGGATDEIGGNHGTLNGSVGFVDGKYGQAGDFGGSEQIDLLEFLVMDKEKATLLWWSKADNTDDEGIFSSSDLYYNIIELRTNLFYGETSWNCNHFNVNNVVKTTEWTHYSLKFENSKSYLYLNGDSPQEADSYGADSCGGSPVSVLLNGLNIENIGGNTGYRDAFQGEIDEIILFDNALTDDQVKALYELDLN